MAADRDPAKEHHAWQRLSHTIVSGGGCMKLYPQMSHIVNSFFLVKFAHIVGKASNDGPAVFDRVRVPMTVHTQRGSRKRLAKPNYSSPFMMTILKKTAEKIQRRCVDELSHQYVIVGPKRESEGRDGCRSHRRGKWQPRWRSGDELPR